MVRETQKSISRGTQEIHSKVDMLSLTHAASTTILTRTEGTVQQLEQSSNETGEAVRDLAERISALDQIPYKISVVVENTIRSLLTTHLKQFAPSREAHPIEELPADVDQNQLTHDKLSPDLQESAAVRSRSTKLEKSNGAGLLRLYRTWLGMIQIRTTDTSYLDTVSNDPGLTTELSLIRRFRSEILIIPKTWLRKRSTLVRYEQQHRLWTTSPITAITVQHFNTVPNSSLIFQVKSVRQARELFASGAASVFDRDESGLTLMDIIFTKIISLLSGYEQLCHDPEINVNIRNLLHLMKFYATHGLDPAGIAYELPDLGGKPPLRRLLDLDLEPVVERPQWNSYISQLTRLIMEHADINPLDLLDLNDIHHGGYWQDSVFPATRAVLSQESWHIDWDELAQHTFSSFSGSMPSMGTRLINLFTSYNLLTMNPEYFKVEDDSWRKMCSTHCHILGLLLAAGMPESSVTEYGAAFEETTVNDGSLLHIAIAHACPGSFSHPQHDKAYARAMVKLEDLLVVCLKHGVDPQSHNLAGVSITSFARTKGVLPIWMAALRKAGFGEGEVIAAAEDIRTRWIPGPEVLVDRRENILLEAMVPPPRSCGRRIAY